ALPPHPSLPISTPSPDSSTRSLHDALPTSHGVAVDAPFTASLGTVSTWLFAATVMSTDTVMSGLRTPGGAGTESLTSTLPRRGRSEEHTSELQSRENLVCRLLLEKKKSPHA